jgi:hypothetical protein
MPDVAGWVTGRRRADSEAGPRPGPLTPLTLASVPGPPPRPPPQHLTPPTPPPTHRDELRGKVEFTHVSRWAQALPHTRIGAYRKIGEFNYTRFRLG